MKMNYILSTRVCGQNVMYMLSVLKFDDMADASEFIINVAFMKYIRHGQKFDFNMRVYTKL